MFCWLSPRNVSYNHPVRSQMWPFAVHRGAGPVCCHLALMRSWILVGRLAGWLAGSRTVTLIPKCFSAGADRSVSSSVCSGYIDGECVEIDGVCECVRVSECVCE